MATFSTSEAISYGWEAQKKNMSFFLPFVLVTTFVPVLISFLLQKAGGGAFISLLFTLVEIYLGMIVMKVTLRIVDGETVTWNNAFQGITGMQMVKYFFVSLVVAIAAGFASLLIIIPGLIVSMGMSQARYFVIDKDTGVMESINRSWEITRGSRLNLFGLYIVSVLVVLLGLICVGVGLLFAIPTVMFAMAHVYRTLETRVVAAA